MSTETDFFPAKNEKGVKGRFENFKQLDVHASREADEEIYKTIITLRTIAVGSSDESVVPVREFNKHQLIDRFPEAWRAFNGEADAMAAAGTPLTDIDMDENTIISMRLAAIRTVEDLAGVSDAGVAAKFGWRTWRGKAQAFLKAKEDELLQAAKDMVTEKRKPGRPKKEAIAA